MSDLEKEIEAVKFLLASFFDDPTEAERTGAIREKAVENVQVKVYARMSEAELKQQLVALQARLNGVIILNYDNLLTFNLCSFGGFIKQQGI